MIVILKYLYEKVCFSLKKKLQEEIPALGPENREKNYLLLPIL